MRILSTKEQYAVSGGLRLAGSAIADRFIRQSPVGSIGSPSLPHLDEDGGGGGSGGTGTGSASWRVTPQINASGESYGISVQGGLGSLSATQEQITATTDVIPNVDVGLTETTHGVTSLNLSLPDINGTSLGLKGSIASTGHLSGNLSFILGGQTLGIAVNSSGQIVGSGAINFDGFTGNVSFNTTTDTLGLSGNLGTWGGITCSYNIFGLGGSDPGFGVECYGDPFGINDNY